MLSAVAFYFSKLKPLSAAIPGGFAAASLERRAENADSMLAFFLIGMLTQSKPRQIAYEEAGVRCK
jgi:hypothetical protein